MVASASLVFRVRRQSPELITPANPTPRELIKPLSDDTGEREGLRFHVPFILFFRHDHGKVHHHDDPVKVIRHALAEALVFYYPFAGRLREASGGKMVLDCTGEGVLFTEADADVSFEAFGDEIKPPFPCLEELLCDLLPAAASNGVLHCPLLLIQVTRLVCGGFIFTIRLNKAMNDFVGVAQFVKAIGAIARATIKQFVPLPQNNKPTLEKSSNYPNHETTDTSILLPSSDNTKNPAILQSFFFGPSEISALRGLLPPHLRHCTKFDLLTASLWRCHAIASSRHPDEPVRVVSVVNNNAGKKINPPLQSAQFYDKNTFAIPMAMSSVGELSQSPLGYAVDLVAKTTSNGVMMMKQECYIADFSTFGVSNNVMRARFGDVDFGWGKPVFAGPASNSSGDEEKLSFYIPYENKRGERGVLVPIQLPSSAMERFKRELFHLLMNKNVALDTKENKSCTLIRSTL